MVKGYYPKAVPLPNNMLPIYIAKQKNPRCKKSEAKSEAPESYSYKRLKSVISGRGQGPSCLPATM